MWEYSYLVDVKALVEPTMFIFGVLITVLAFTIKGLVTLIILRDKKYTNGEKKFAFSCFIPKGIAVANFSLILMPTFEKMGLFHIIDFMIIIATIGIVVSIPLGITILNNKSESWLSEQ